MPAEPTPNPTAEPHLSERTQLNIAMLQRLANQGAEIATRFHEQVLEIIPAGPILAALGGTHSSPIITHDIMATYDLIARAVRRTVLLIEHLAKTSTPPAKSRPQPREPAPNPVTPEPLETIRPLRPNPAEPELYQPEYRDRLDPLDRVNEIGHLPIPKIIASIHHALAAGEKLVAHHSNDQPAEDSNPEDWEIELPIPDDPGTAASNPFARRKP